MDFDDSEHQCCADFVDEDGNEAGDFILPLSERCPVFCGTEEYDADMMYCCSDDSEGEILYFVSDTVCPTFCGMEEYDPEAETCCEPADPDMDLWPVLKGESCRGDLLDAAP